MNYSNLLDRYPIFEQIRKVADQLQLETYVVGGFVRDLLLRKPSKDIDIVCVGSGIQLAQAVARALGSPRQVAVFKNFGTAMLRCQGWDLEFVGARKESYNRSSRKPVVEGGTLADDQCRRDFTINTLAIGLHSRQWGELVDDLGGLEDLARQVIQTPRDPSVTFSDDPLRMIRAIRFATQLRFTISPDTLGAIQQNVARISIVSQERITDEFNKILGALEPVYGLKLLFQTGLLALILPELVALQGQETIQGHSHKDSFYHTLQVLDNVAGTSTNLWLRWAALLHDIAKPRTKQFDPITGFSFHGHEDLGAKMVPKIFRKMKLPLRENMAYVQKLVRLHLRPIVLAQDVVTDSAIRRLLVEAGDALEDLMLLCRADITSNDSARVQRYLQNFDKVEEKINQVAVKDQLRNFQPAITGDTIMQTFRLRPSKLVGTIKGAIREAILAGVIENNYKQAYTYMLRLGEEHGLRPAADQ
ncbi:MAG: HD domain-containing protein [Bacteroidota bacterium]